MPITLRFIFKNLADSSSISATPNFLSTKWPTNLLLPGRDTGRSSSTAAQDILMTWASNQSVNCAGITGHNLTKSVGTIRARAYSDITATTLISGADVGPTVAYSGTGVDDLEDQSSSDFRGLRNTIFDFASTYTTVRSVKLSIADAANTDGYFDMRRVWVGKKFDAQFGAQYGGLNIRSSNRSSVGDLEDGGMFADRRAPYRIVNLNLNWIAEADRAALFAGFRYVGKDREFYMSALKGEGASAEVYYQGVFRCVSEPDFSENSYGLLSSNFQLRET